MESHTPARNIKGTLATQEFSLLEVIEIVKSTVYNRLPTVFY